jgi:hypothetical protein
MGNEVDAGTTTEAAATNETHAAAAAGGAQTGGETKTFMERFWLPIILAIIPATVTVIVAFKPDKKEATKPTTTTTATPTETKRVASLSMELNVRDDAHGSEKIVTKLPAGTQLEILGEVPDGFPPGKAEDRNPWFYVSFADPMAPDKKLSGWVSSVGVVVR